MFWEGSLERKGGFIVRTLLEDVLVLEVLSIGWNVICRVSG
jgi:hypothetical protein